MKKYKRGYTTGVYDMFHIGHLNILKKAKQRCEYLIVAVSTDELVVASKNKMPIIPFKQRFEIVNSIKYVNKTIAQNDYSVEGKIKAVITNKLDVVFVGSEWKNTEKWKKISKELKKIGCDVVFLKHTDGISSSLLREQIKNESIQ